MKLKRFAALIICVCVMLSAFPVAVHSADMVPAIRGETSRTTKEIALSDGTKTGVQLTQINISGYYGNNRVINVAEGDLSNTNLSLEVINCGTYVVSTRTMNNAAAQYNTAHPGQTVLAAVNGDLWMTGYHTHSGITKKTLSATRGILIIDGEIWASEQIDQENITATNVEKGTPAAEKTVIGVTGENQPVMGAPNIRVQLSVGGKSIQADGINRLPATDAIIVYNNRISSSNYALNDSYEVEIAVDDAALSLSGSVTGTIKAIYESGSTTRPSLSDRKTIVLTARGSRINELKKLCSVGGRVTLTPTVNDKLGNTEMWKQVEDAISGHMRVMHDGVGAPIPDNTYYPTTLIGYKDDGTVSLVTVTSAFDKSRNALKISQSYDLCTELGFNSVFFLDGGGSATFVALENGTYTIRNKCSDGSARSVINGVGLVWNDTPVCMRQGSLNHIGVPAELSEISPLHLDGALINDLTTYSNAINTSYDKTQDCFSMTVNTSTNDPYALVNYSLLKRVNANDYPYIVIKLMTTATVNTNLTLYYSCGSDTGPAQSRTASATVPGNGKWQTITMNMSGKSGWSGLINNIRIDTLEGKTSQPGEAVYIKSITLCKSMDEVSRLASGWLPEGSCENYYELTDSLRPTPYFITGDITGDGSVDMVDMLTMKLIAKGKKLPDKSQCYSADVDGDGSITMIDSFEMKYRLKKGKWRY